MWKSRKSYTGIDFFGSVASEKDVGGTTDFVWTDCGKPIWDPFWSFFRLQKPIFVWKLWNSTYATRLWKTLRKAGKNDDFFLLETIVHSL
jgi:hypothetical protein